MDPTLAIFVGALAEAILTVVVEDLGQRQSIEGMRRFIQGASKQSLALQIAISKAYQQFNVKYPELVEAFFDEVFLRQELVVFEISRLLRVGSEPNPLNIHNAWRQYFHIETDISEAIQYFLQSLEIEIKAQPALLDLTQARTLDQIERLNESQLSTQLRLAEYVQQIAQNTHFVPEILVQLLEEVKGIRNHLESPTVGENLKNKPLYGNSLDIATNRSRILRVLAGPGTGKTYALVRRVGSLIQTGSDPKRILVVTFTRMATNDLARELAVLGIRGTEEVKVSTLHSFCLAVLKRANVFLMIGRNAHRTVLKFEERFLLEDMKYGLEGKLSTDFGDYYNRRRILRAFEAAWAREPEQVPGSAGTDIDRLFSTLLHTWLIFHGAMLLAEIIPESLKYLRNNPGCEERDLYDHILVDEYQDLNIAEQRLIQVLVGSEKSLTVIGDENQSIYESFRYAHLEGITRFKTLYPEAHDISLIISRRNPTKIFDLSQNLIRLNQNRLDRILLPRPLAGEGEIHVVQWATMQAEAEGIARFIDHRIRAGRVKHGEILILSPRSVFGKAIQDALKRLNHQSRSFFDDKILDANPKVLEQSGAQQAFSLLRLFVNPKDRVSLRCWLGFGDENLAADQYTGLYKHCRDTGLSPFDVLKDLSSGALSLSNTNYLVRRYQVLVDQLNKLNQLAPTEAVQFLFPIEQEWARFFHNYADKLGEGMDLKEYLDGLERAVISPEIPTEVDYIRIMSLQSSKGLTANHVIITGCIEGLIPSEPRDAETMSLTARTRFQEEQRRLFYVAITRATDTLVLSSILEIERAVANKLGGVKMKGGSREIGKTIASTFISEQLGSSLPEPIIGQNWKY